MVTCMKISTYCGKSLKTSLFFELIVFCKHAFKTFNDILRFRNISRIMDCVGCEKCRLWGKLQILGVGTAIKVLLMTPPTTTTSTTTSKTAAASEKDSCDQDEDGEGAVKKLVLNRQEVIALLNTLNQLSKSVEFASRIMNEHRRSEDKQEEQGIQQQEVVDSGDNSNNKDDFDVIADASSDTLYLMKTRTSSSSKLKLKKTKGEKSKEISVPTLVKDSIMNNDSHTNQSAKTSALGESRNRSWVLSAVRDALSRFLAYFKYAFQKFLS